MWKFKPEEVFKTNPDPLVSVKEVPRINQRVVIADNFYLQPQKVRKLILGSPCPIFHPSQTNFVDYYDCRQSMGTSEKGYPIQHLDCGQKQRETHTVF